MCGVYGGPFDCYPKPYRPTPPKLFLWPTQCSDQAAYLRQTDPEAQEKVEDGGSHGSGLRAWGRHRRP